MTQANAAQTCQETFSLTQDAGEETMTSYIVRDSKTFIRSKFSITQAEEARLKKARDDRDERHGYDRLGGDRDLINLDQWEVDWILRERQQKKLAREKAAAVERARLAVIGEIGKDGVNPAGIDNYTGAQLRRKIEILKEGGFSKAEARRQLVKQGAVVVKETLLKKPHRVADSQEEFYMTQEEKARLMKEGAGSKNGFYFIAFSENILLDQWKVNWILRERLKNLQHGYSALPTGAKKEKMEERIQQAQAELSRRKEAEQARQQENDRRFRAWQRSQGHIERSNNSLGARQARREKIELKEWERKHAERERKREKERRDARRRHEMDLNPPPYPWNAGWWWYHFGD